MTLRDGDKDPHTEDTTRFFQLARRYGRRSHNIAEYVVRSDWGEDSNMTRDFGDSIQRERAEGILDYLKILWIHMGVLITYFI